MIREDRYEEALEALRVLVTRSAFLAYEAGAKDVGDLLNDIEMLPEYIADEKDRTEDFRDMLENIAQLHPVCRPAVDLFKAGDVHSRKDSA
ncbi:MAG: hypothetical protein KY476_22740 [Planctomycetes bacterium]|nr:hypothetical protein [Planctomycetota bacterium]